MSVSYIDALTVFLGAVVAGETGLLFYRNTVSFRDVLGAVLVAAFIGVLGMLLWKVIPKENEQLIVYMLGQLSGFVAGVVAYHYVRPAGEKELEQTRTENTGKALDAIKAAQEAAPVGLNTAERPTGTEEDPVHVEDTTNA